MEKSINVLISDLKNDLILTVNKYNLPIVVSSMVINELAMQITNHANQAIDNERKLEKTE